MQSANSRDIEDIAALLRERYGCHTAILYGSHATGQVTTESDYDVAGFAPVAEVERVTGPWRDSYLDLFIHPESRATTATAEMLHLRGGVVLFQADGSGDRLLEQLERIYAAGPQRLSESETRARRNWAWKMLDRASRGDVEGDFRRAWLLTALLEDYFHLDGRWYEGPKRSLAYLSKTDPVLYSAFESALAPGATMDSIAGLVRRVAGPRNEDQT